MPHALTLTDVTKRYRTVTAVDRLGFHVEQQEIFALLGPNGAGKTTTVRMIQGILEPDAGRIEFGVDGTRGHCRPGLGYLPEDRGLYRDQPIHRTLEIFGRLRGLSKASARRECRAWLERFGLADRRRERLDALSKGNQQKVQFAAAVLHRPRLAVLDEPFSGLDPVNQDLFLDLLEELRREGMTILLSAHQMDLVERCADRLLILADGRPLHESRLDALSADHTRGHSLTVHRRGDVDRDVTPDPALILSVAPRPDGGLQVDARPGVALETVLAHVASWGALESVTTSRPRLHDIYVDLVANAGPGADTPADGTRDDDAPRDGNPDGRAPDGGPPDVDAP